MGTKPNDVSRLYKVVEQTKWSRRTHDHTSAATIANNAYRCLFLAEERRLEAGFHDVEWGGDNGAAHASETTRSVYISAYASAIPRKECAHPPATKCSHGLGLEIGALGVVIVGAEAIAYQNI